MCRNLEVFILTCNRSALLRETLQSVCAQAAEGFKIVILDNASMDNTRVVFEEFRALYPNREIEFCSTAENIGAIANLNRAKSLAEREWLMLFHDDDLMHPDYIQTIMALLQKTPGAVMGGSTYIPLKNPENSNWRKLSSIAYFCEVKDFAAVLFSRVSHCFSSAVYKTEVFRGAEFEEAKYGKICDRPFMLKIAEEGVSIILQDHYIRYRTHEGQDTSNMDSGPFGYEWLALMQNYKEYLDNGRLTRYGKVYNDYIYEQLRSGYRWMSSVNTKMSFEQFVVEAVEKGVISRFARLYGSFKYRVRCKFFVDLYYTLFHTEIKRVSLTRENKVRDYECNLAEFDTSSDFVVFISHTRIYFCNGGTEKFQVAQIQYLNQQDINVYQIYPMGKKSPKSIFAGRRLYGVNCNGSELASNIGFDKITALLRSASASEHFRFLSIQHLLNWDLPKVVTLLGYLKNIPVRYYAHDMYFICPSKFLYFNNTEYCGALEKGFSGDVCKKCRFGGRVQKHQEYFHTILDAVDKIICPSKIIEKGFLKFFPEFSFKLSLQEHLVLNSKHSLPPKVENARLRIAYLGSAARHKGFDEYKDLSAHEKLTHKYDFYHIGSEINYKETMTSVGYSFLHNGENIARDTLLQYNIDIVYLWSKVPESYSYTLHEAFSAGLPIVSFRDSGNIAYKVATSQIYGRVFDSINELIEFLDNESAVREFIENNPNKFLLNYEPNLAEIL